MSAWEELLHVEEAKRNIGKLSLKMYMFQSILERIPKTRSELVNDLEIPEVAVAPFVISDPEVSEDSDVSVSDDLEETTNSSESSLALSRAMTDSDIDYDRYKRLKNRSSSDTFLQMRKAMEAFPSDYLDSLNSFQYSSSETSTSEESNIEPHKYNDELVLKMQRFFDDECRVFEPDDPGLIAYEEAIKNIHFKDSDLDSSSL